MKRQPTNTYTPSNQKSMRDYLCDKYGSWFVNNLMLKFFQRACRDERFIRDIVFDGLDASRVTLECNSEVIE